jgi:hypothetical protein
MKLPFSLSDNFEGLRTNEMLEDAINLEGNEFLDQFLEIESHEADVRLKALVLEYSSMPDCVGFCFVDAYVHGYNFQKLIIQHFDGTFTAQAWDSGTNKNETTKLIIDLDLSSELDYLRKDSIVLRKAGVVNHNIDQKSKLENRYCWLYIISGNNAEWLLYPRLLKGGIYTNNAANRLLRAVDNMNDDVELV